MVSTRHSLPRHSSTAATLSPAPTTVSAVTSNTATEAEDPLTILPTDDTLTVKKKRALQRNLAIDGTEALKGDRKRRQHDVSETDVYHFRGAVYEIPQDQQIPKEWIEMEPERYKKRKIKQSMTGHVTWGSLSVPVHSSVFQQSQGTSLGGGDAMRTRGKYLNSNDGMEQSGGADPGDANDDDWRSEEGSVYDDAEVEVSGGDEGAGRTGGFDGEESSSEDIHDNSGYDSRTRSVDESDPDIGGDEETGSAEEGAINDATESSDAFDQGINKKKPYDGSWMNEIRARVAEEYPRRTNDPDSMSGSQDGMNQQDSASKTVTSIFHGEFQDELNEDGEPKRKLPRGLGALNPKRLLVKLQADATDVELKVKKAARVSKAKAGKEAQKQAKTAEKEAQKASGRVTRRLQASKTDIKPGTTARARRISNTTSEQRRRQTENARAARSANAAARRLEKMGGAREAAAKPRTRTIAAASENAEDDAFKPTARSRKRRGSAVSVGHGGEASRPATRHRTQHESSPTPESFEDDRSLSPEHDPDHAAKDITMIQTGDDIAMRERTNSASVPAASANRYGYNEDDYYEDGYIPEMDGRRRGDAERKHALADKALAEMIAAGKRNSQVKGFATAPLAPTTTIREGVMVAAAFVPAPLRLRAQRLTREAQIAGLDFNDLAKLEDFARRDDARKNITHALSMLGAKGHSLEYAKQSLVRSKGLWKGQPSVQGAGSVVGDEVGCASSGRKTGGQVSKESRKEDGTGDMSGVAGTESVGLCGSLRFQDANRNEEEKSTGVSTDKNSGASGLPDLRPHGNSKSDPTKELSFQTRPRGYADIPIADTANASTAFSISTQIITDSVKPARPTKSTPIVTGPPLPVTAPLTLPTHNTNGNALRWSLSRRIGQAGSAEYSISHRRLQGESANAKRRRIKRELEVLRGWGVVDASGGAAAGAGSVGAEGPGGE